MLCIHNLTLQISFFLCNTKPTCRQSANEKKCNYIYYDYCRTLDKFIDGFAINTVLQQTKLEL